MDYRYIHTSLTRISNLSDVSFTVQPQAKAGWHTGDYVVMDVTDVGTGQFQVELPEGRMIDIMRGDRLIGALGVRHATLECTGTWEAVGEDGRIHVLTGAGLLGRMTSKAAFFPPVISGRYAGHVMVDGRFCNMQDFVVYPAALPFELPVALLIGTSMSAGKTTAGRIIVRQLRNAGLRIAGAKLTGAGRYKDILAFRDAGADTIFDFVDMGLPSTVCAPAVYLPALQGMLSRLSRSGADVAVIEIGASPLEPYNGDLAYRAIRDQVRFTVLCASDPYAGFGIMESFGVRPDIVSGPATNTLGGRELVKKLCGVCPLNLTEPETLPELCRRLFKKLGIVVD